MTKDSYLNNKNKILVSDEEDDEDFDDGGVELAAVYKEGLEVSHPCFNF